MLFKTLNADLIVYHYRHGDRATQRISESPFLSNYLESLQINAFVKKNSKKCFLLRFYSYLYNVMKHTNTHDTEAQSAGSVTPVSSEIETKKLTKKELAQVFSLKKRKGNKFKRFGVERLDTTYIYKCAAKCNVDTKKKQRSY